MDNLDPSSLEDNFKNLKLSESASCSTAPTGNKPQIDEKKSMKHGNNASHSKSQETPTKQTPQKRFTTLNEFINNTPKNANPVVQKLFRDDCSAMNDDQKMLAVPDRALLRTGKASL